MFWNSFRKTRSMSFRQHIVDKMRKTYSQTCLSNITIIVTFGKTNNMKGNNTDIA